MVEINLFIAKAERYLQSAELLLNNGDYDSSVSRVYYAMFHLANGLLLTKGITASTHKGTLLLFGEHFIKTDICPKEMSQALKLAHDDRQSGDYDVYEMIEEEEARLLLEKGRYFMKQTRLYLEQQNLANS
ncbi:MAG: HEPN domain-containing protein [SAR324 cluster bacterium]|nr:HEPN domain-containing protein [SAR324 cluster bacterium]